MTRLDHYLTDNSAAEAVAKAERVFARIGSGAKK